MIALIRRAASVYIGGIVPLLLRSGTDVDAKNKEDEEKRILFRID
jgi:hypothetical protein